MEKHYSDSHVYTFEAPDMRKLESIRTRLYGERALTPDERRDLANLLDTVMHNVTTTLVRF